jgi:hypothetical protein
MLVDAGIPGTILVIEPRRMAARLLAGWVAKQRGATLGHEVGYAVRFDTKYGKDTRILYLTDGVFQRWIQDDPELSGVGAVVFDEFHERRLAVDVATCGFSNTGHHTRNRRPRPSGGNPPPPRQGPGQRPARRTTSRNPGVGENGRRLPRGDGDARTGKHPDVSAGHP